MKRIHEDIMKRLVHGLVHPKKKKRRESIEKAIDFRGKSPLEGLRETCRLFLGLQADWEDVFILKYWEDELPAHRQRDLAQVKLVIEYLVRLYQTAQAEDTE